MGRLATVFFGVFALAGAAAAQSPFDPPPAPDVALARSLVAGMQANERGPYSRIRWYCNDGTVQPPEAYACSERGGGRQHAEYSPDRARLAELGFHVGTVFAAMEWDEFFDAGNRNQRLRELPLERYLTDIDDGWVLRQAQNYRGRIQIEDEERIGRDLLATLLADREWLADNLLLAREVARVVPHTGGTDDRARAVRRGAIEIANLDSAFERLRVEIHTAPRADTAGRVRSWAESKEGDIQQAALDLAAELDELYGPSGRQTRLEAQRRLLAARPLTAGLGSALAIEEGTPVDKRFDVLSHWLYEARMAMNGAASGEQRLLILDASREVENELTLVTAELLAGGASSRGELLATGRMLIDATYGVGLLTDGEYADLQALWGNDADTELAFSDYERMLNALRRVPQWSVGSVRYAFAETLVRYTALDPRAQAFVDDLLRSSPLTGIAEVTRRLNRDHGRLTGVSREVAGRSDIAAFGVNPGIALGTLRIFETSEELEHGVYDRNDIVLLPETVAELGRVAGIVTLGEGNPLSHVQLLARNFGIPNVAVLPEAVGAVRELENEEVVLAVASDGSVVLTASAEVDPEIRNLLLPANANVTGLTVPRPDLSVRQPIPLADLERSLSGRVVGPKAANLGQLARLFPGRVAPAVAVPFGVFAAHMNEGSPSLREQLVETYAARDRGELDADEVLARLDAIRQGIAAMQLLPEYRTELVAAMTREFGDQPGYGIFLRSDTNVEDLPEFTGAGLSETVANVVGLEAQLATLPRIWASVLSPRAIAWRSDLLTNPEEVYASVLLMQSVPSTKSGVMVTTDLNGGGAGLTVSTGWGVGGAVAGEAVETVLLRPDGTLARVSEAKTAYQRSLDPAGGIRWLPAADGRVLEAAEIDQLRALAADVAARYAPVYDTQGRQRPWDIEFGFVDGELTLFQIRPLVERGAQLADTIIATLTEKVAVAIPETVAVAEILE